LERKRLEIQVEEFKKENENLKRQKFQRDELIEQLTKQNELHKTYSKEMFGKYTDI
jgi:hypothetical protein